MSGNIRGAIPPRPGPKTEIVRILTSETHYFAIVSKSIWGQWIHWYGNRSHECTADKRECENCLRSWPRKWLGYLEAIDDRTKKVCFIEMTNTAWHQLKDMVAEDEPLRGLVINIRKTKGGKHGRFLFDIRERKHDEALLPPEQDPLPILRFLWNCKKPARQVA